MGTGDNLQKAWEETGRMEFMEALKGFRGEDLGEIVWSEKHKKNWESALDQAKTKNKVLICADERVLPKEGEFKVGTAGQLILESKEYQDDFAESFRGEIKTVRSHSGCGAAAVAYSRLSEEEKQRCLSAISGLTVQGLKINEVSQGDLCGIYHSYNLAQKLGAAFEHTPFSAMRGYRDFHDARIIFWSSNENFDPSNLTGKFLPPHFLANGLTFGLTNDYCKEELKLLSGIALGKHGFYNLFNADNPFYVISVGGNAGDAKRLNGTAKKTLKEFGERIVFRYIG